MYNPRRPDMQHTHMFYKYIWPYIWHKLPVCTNVAYICLKYEHFSPFTLTFMRVGGGVGVSFSAVLCVCRYFARCAKLRVAHLPGMLGTVSPRPRISDRDMHHSTCVTHVPWCMPGSYRLVAVSFEIGGGKNVPCIPGACATRNFTYPERGPCFFKIVMAISSFFFQMDTICLLLRRRMNRKKKQRAASNSGVTSNNRTSNDLKTSTWRLLVTFDVRTLASSRV